MSDIIGFWPTDVVDAHTTLQESPDGTLNLFRSRARKVISTWIKASTQQHQPFVSRGLAIAKSKRKSPWSFRNTLPNGSSQIFPSVHSLPKRYRWESKLGLPEDIFVLQCSHVCVVPVCCSCVRVVCVCVRVVCVCVCVCVCMCSGEREKRTLFLGNGIFERGGKTLCVVQKEHLGQWNSGEGGRLVVVVVVARE